MHYLVNNTQLNVLESGNGPLTLVFLHYFGGSAMEWQFVIAQLADQYRCVAVDLRGHGDSSSPETYTVGDMADDVQALTQAMGIQDFVLIGHSMSGKVALALASRQPAGLQLVLLLSPSPPEPEPISDTDRQEMLETHGQQTAAEETYAKITAKPLSKLIKAQIIADNLRTSEAAWNAWLLLGSKETISEQMLFILVPIHILVGTKDKALLPDVQQEMTLPYLPGATLESVDGAGHLLPWETPDELTIFIRAKVGVMCSNTELNL
ncbi:alpha/beta fold hydrolase [Spirosoma luteum]|uniref:alpha/beta fold hydrolase n=1 Tax=Spirosoma luteum TaxID=431553 RepID=UPI00037E9519|nr:alpha/beta hydrolase [Spirosoma luteum]